MEKSNRSTNYQYCSLKIGVVDPYPHQFGNLDPHPHQIKIRIRMKWRSGSASNKDPDSHKIKIRIRINVMRIHNTAKNKFAVSYRLFPLLKLHVGLAALNHGGQARVVQLQGRPAVLDTLSIPLHLHPQNNSKQVLHKLRQHLKNSRRRVLSDATLEQRC